MKLTDKQIALLRHFPKDGKWRRAPFHIKILDYRRWFGRPTTRPVVYTERLRSITLTSLFDRDVLECRAVFGTHSIRYPYTSFAWEWRRKIPAETYAPASKSELDKRPPF